MRDSSDGLFRGSGTTTSALECGGAAPVGSGNTSREWADVRLSIDSVSSEWPSCGLSITRLPRTRRDLMPSVSPHWHGQ